MNLSDTTSEATSGLSDLKGMTAYIQASFLFMWYFI